MQKIIQITDTHVCPPGGRVLGLDPAARLRAVIGEINERHSDADLCMLTGDLTDQGEVEAYRLLKESLAGLRVPYRLLLGNHDARSPFRAVFAEAEVDQDGFVQSVVELGESVCLLLDTLDEGRPGEGFLCDLRLAWLDAQLARFAGRRAVVFLHHPPLSVGLRWFEGMLLANGEALMERLVRHGNVAHVAFGHVHVNTSGCWGGVSYSASRGTCHKILADPEARQADYVDQGPAYDVLLIGNESVAVHTIDPAVPHALIAREYPTPDGRGRLELLGASSVRLAI